MKKLFLVIVLAGSVAFGMIWRGGQIVQSAGTESTLHPKATLPASTTPSSLQQVYAKLPLYFEANQGQTDPTAKFLARGQGYSLFLTATGAVLRVQAQKCEPGNACVASADVLRMNLVGAQLPTQIAGRGELAGKSNYFLGNNPRQWRTNVPQYEQVEYRAVYPGIDLIYYGQQQQLEYDFLVAPQANAQAIRLDFQGAQKMRLAANGDLLLHMQSGILHLQKPVAYQMHNGQRRTVAARYRLQGKSGVSFALGSYDRTQPLVIDPVLMYSTYLGGTASETGRTIAVDKDGNAYIAGETLSNDFPGASPIQATRGNVSDAFVLKLNAAGSQLLYATWLGGDGDDMARKIVVDTEGNAYVTGNSTSSNFPTTNGAFQRGITPDGDVFVTKINPTGSALLYSTLLGGNATDTAFDLAVDENGNAYVAGSSLSTNLPVTGLQTARRGNSLYKTTNQASNWSGSNTLLTGLTNALALDPSNADTLYAATVNGVFKSADGGQQWQRLATLASPTTTVNSVAVHPSTPTTLYAAAVGGLFKSTDGGALWMQQQVPLTSFFYFSVVIDPANPNTVYVGTGSGVAKTTNGGETWTAINNGMALFPGSGSVPQVNRLVIDRNNPSTLYAATNRGLFRTTDGGATWIRAVQSVFAISDGNIRDLFIDPTTPTTLYAMAISVGAGLYKTTDGALTWSLVTSGIPIPVGTNTITTQIVSLAIDPAIPTTLYGGIPGSGVFKSTDGGVNWTAANTGLSNLQVSAFAMAPNGTLYTATNSGSDGFVAKLNPTGSALTYLTYLGGDESDTVMAIAVDKDGNAVIAGPTSARNFPTVNPWQAANAGGSDAFVAKLNSAGSGLLWSSYLGGLSGDNVTDLALNSAGQAIITGTTTSTNFPTVNPLQATNKGGNEIFVAKVRTDGTGVDFSTYLGGTRNDSPTGVALDVSGNIHLTGSTDSPDFPLATPIQAVLGGGSTTSTQTDAFYIGLNATGSVLTTATYLGGTSAEVGYGIAVDTTGSVYVTGTTLSANFPVVTTIQPYKGNSDLFVVKLAQSADVAVRLTDLPDPVMVNNNLTYNVAVTNNGPDPAKDVVVTTPLPAGVNFVSATTSGGNCSGTSTITCTLGELAARASATIAIVVKPTNVGTLNATATVTNSTPDANAANNTSTIETKVGTTPSIFGRVRFSNGAALGQVSVAVSGATTAITTTNAGGEYQFAELTAGATYAVAPTREGHVFNPPSRSLPNLTTDQAADFQAVQCGYEIYPDKQIFTAAGGAGMITLLANDPQCPWTARSAVPWITMTVPPSGTGNGAIIFKVAPTTVARSGKIVVAGNVFTVWQEFRPCGDVTLNTPPLFPFRDAHTYNSYARMNVKDFNKDGRSDLTFLTLENPQNVSYHVVVALSKADGGFEAPIKAISLFGGEGLGSLFAEDLNGDGNLDLVTAGNTAEAGRLLVSMGNGAGGFAAPVSTTLSRVANVIAVADFNSDTKPDIALSTGLDPRIIILLNNGAGAFPTSKELNLTGQTNGVSLATAADFNGDGKMDLAALCNINKYVLLQGDGTGGLSFVKLEDTVPNSTELTSGDVTGDGTVDLLVTGITGVLLHPNPGATGYTAPRLLMSGSAAHSIVIADLNADGKRDVATAYFDGIAVMFADGKGGFGAPMFWQSGIANSYSSGNSSLGVGDFNRDGVPDLAQLGLLGIPDSQGTLTEGINGLSLVFGTGKGTFAAPRNFRVQDFYGNSNEPELESGDLNDDGIADVAVVYDADKLGVMFGNGRGELSVPAVYQTGTVPRNIKLADFNADGKLDITFLNWNNSTISVLLNNGKGGFSAKPDIATGPQPRALAVADFNSDGIQDLLAKSPTSGLALLLGDGKGLFAAAATGIAADFTDAVVTVGDFNGDGNADFSALSPELYTTSGDCGGNAGKFGIWLGNGKGEFTNVTNTILTQRPRVLHATDLNGDGQDDLLFTTNCFNNEGLFVMLAQGNGTFAAPVKYSLGAVALNPRSATIADLNGDGKPDVVVANTNTHNLSLLLGKGDGTLQPAVNLPVGAKPAFVAVNDFNEDGRPDLVVSRAESATLALLLNQNSCSGAQQVVTTSAASYSGASLTPEAVASAFGTALATATEAAASLPLPISLAGTTVKITDSAGVTHDAPLFFVSAQQVNYQVPKDAAPGVAIVTITNSVGQVATGTIRIAAVAPGVFAATQDGQGWAAATLLYVKGAMRWSGEVSSCDASRTCIGQPIDLQSADEVFLELYGTGIRRRSDLANVQATIDGENVPVLYAGAQCCFAGVDQINLLLPKTLAGRGEVEIRLVIDGKAANPVRIKIR